MFVPASELQLQASLARSGMPNPDLYIITIKLGRMNNE